MTDTQTPVKGEDYGSLASEMLKLCEGKPYDLALAAASAVVARLIGAHSDSERAAVLQAKHIGNQINQNAKIDWQTAQTAKAGSAEISD
jgi:hypothetical protein